MARIGMFFDGISKQCGDCGHTKKLKGNFSKSGNVSQDPNQSSYWYSRCDECRLTYAREYQARKKSETKLHLEVWRSRIALVKFVESRVLPSTAKITNGGSSYEFFIGNIRIKSVLLASSYSLRGWHAHEIRFMDHVPDEDTLGEAKRRVWANDGRVLVLGEVVK